MQSRHHQLNSLRTATCAIAERLCVVTHCSSRKPPELVALRLPEQVRVMLSKYDDASTFSLTETAEPASGTRSKSVLPLVMLIRGSISSIPMPHIRNQGLPSPDTVLELDISVWGGTMRCSGIPRIRRQLPREDRETERATRDCVMQLCSALSSRKIKHKSDRVTHAVNILRARCKSACRVVRSLLSFSASLFKVQVHRKRLRTWPSTPSAVRCTTS